MAAPTAPMLPLGCTRPCPRRISPTPPSWQGPLPSTHVLGVQALRACLSQCSASRPHTAQSPVPSLGSQPSPFTILLPPLLVPRYTGYLATISALSRLWLISTATPNWWPWLHGPSLGCPSTTTTMTSSSQTSPRPATRGQMPSGHSSSCSDPAPRAALRRPSRRPNSTPRRPSPRHRSTRCLAWWRTSRQSPTRSPACASTPTLHESRRSWRSSGRPSTETTYRPTSPVGCAGSCSSF